MALTRSSAVRKVGRDMPELGVALHNAVVENA